MVIIADPAFISSATSIVDQDEYRETMQNINTIVNDATAFLDDYIQYMNGAPIMAQQEFQRRYARSTLPYFDALLNIAKKD